MTLEVDITLGQTDNSMMYLNCNVNRRRQSMKNYAQEKEKKTQ